MVRSKESLEAEYRRRTTASHAQWKQSAEVLPAGVGAGQHWQPPYPVYIERGGDCHVWDLDGNRYVDFYNNEGAMILGHSHPAVVEALERTLDRGIGLGWPTDLEIEIADEITNRYASVEQVRYVNSGLEASVHVARMVRAVTGMPKIARFVGAQHGHSDAMEFEGGADGEMRAAPAQRGMPPGAADDVVMLPYNDRETVELHLREHASETAAVFFDATPAAMDVTDDFARHVRELTSELGVLLVMDEVSSFRAGYSGYQGVVGIEPDISIFGKPFGGGLPVGVIGGRKDLMSALDSTEEPTGLNQSGTFSGNSFTLAAGLATLKALTPEAYEHLDGLRQRLHAGLARVFADLGAPVVVRSAGSAVRLVFDEEAVTQAFGDSVEGIEHRTGLSMLLKGHYARPRFPEFSLSLPMTFEHVDAAVAAMGQTLSELD